MVAVEIFSSSVQYKYKSKICSLSFFVVLFFVILSLLTPFFIIYNAGGFSLKNRVYAEKPDVSFNYKYLLLVLEVDANNDGKKDILKFEAYFYTDRPIKSVKLLLFFNFRLKQLFEATIESIALWTRVLNEKIQKVQFSGDLILQQRGLLTSEGLYEIYNHSIEMADYSLDELLVQNFNRKFAAKIHNEYIKEQTGNLNKSAAIIQGELIYREHLIYYQPSYWEELKWAWVQYLSCLLAFLYITKHILIFLFTNRYLNCYIIMPWKNK
ncbi:transmembrane protein 231-like isoform X2 [Xylocopa sonorina]|uniref:transmembrane protein 231-like isoform X2 n=1 Tax=Xylocopa sonorina TaxID=1818115 RepID=UPI00403B3239